MDTDPFVVGKSGRCQDGAMSATCNVGSFGQYWSESYLLQ